MSVLGWAHYYEFWAYPGDLEIASLDYDLDKAKVISQKPIGVFDGKYENDSSIIQENIVTFSYDKSEAYSWSHNLGVGLTVMAGGEAGVPFFAKGYWEVSVSTTYNYQTTKSVVNTVERSYSSRVRVAPGTKVQAECTIQEAKL